MVAAPKGADIEVDVPPDYTVEGRRTRRPFKKSQHPYAELPVAAF